MKVQKVCLNCGTVFQVSESETKRRERKFCSQNCYVAYKNKTHGWIWGIGRKLRPEGWRNKLSETKKQLYSSGKLTNPMLGKKRPDLADRNRARKGLPHPTEPRRYTEDFVLELYEKYKTYKGGLRGFAKINGCYPSPLREAFHKYVPSSELDLTMERKKDQNKHYACGRNFEWRVRDYYKRLGYWVLRSPRSGGPVDLVAIKKGETLLIQCKTHGYLPQKERQELANLAESIGANALLVWRGLPPRYDLQIEVLTKKETQILEWLGTKKEA